LSVDLALQDGRNGVRAAQGLKAAKAKPRALILVKDCFDAYCPSDPI
jgi:hypothetical protein